MTRPTIHRTMMTVARTFAERSTCVRRKVGCVLVNADNWVLATGFNGVARGTVHCIDRPCPGAGAGSGQGLDLCQAIHAEQNALLQVPDVTEIYAAYCTTAPCVTCVKLLMNTTCRLIVYADSYAHDEHSRELWPFEWCQLQPDGQIRRPS